jgi:hypothetical protein
MVVKLAWAKLFIGEDGTLHTIKCKVCTKVEGKNKIFGAKWDSLCKHAACQKVVMNII